MFICTARSINIWLRFPFTGSCFRKIRRGGSEAFTPWMLSRSTILARVVAQENIPVNSRHHQAVDQMGPGVLATGLSEDGITEAIEYPARRFVLGIQWHPEDRIDISATDRAIFEAFAKEVGS